MARKRISGTDLIWMFHEELKEFGDYPLQGISLAILPQNKGEWTAVRPRNVRVRRAALWAARIDAIEKRLRKQYILAAD